MIGLIEATYGDQSIGVSRDCSIGSISEHKEGRALDWMLDVRDARERETAKVFLDWLTGSDQQGNGQAMVRRMGVMYIVWNNRMWRAYDPARGWDEYRDCLSHPESSYNTTCHRDHIHISMTWDGGTARTSYYSGRVMPGLCRASTYGAPPRLPTSGTTFVPLQPKRLLHTRKGRGLEGPCRLGVSGTTARVDVPVLGRAGVPDSGVSAVVIGLSAGRTSAPTAVTVYPTGGNRPSTPSVIARPGDGRDAVTVVPLGVDGKISVANRTGGSDVRMEVLGYYRSPGIAGTRFTASKQRRIMATRLDPGETRRLRVGGRAGIPGRGVRAAMLSVTAGGSGRSGKVAVWRAGTDAPNLPQLRYGAGEIRTNRVVVATSDRGRIKLKNRSRGSVRLRVDTVGFHSASGAGYVPLRNARVLDTRSGLGVSRAFGPREMASMPMAGRAGIPADAAAVVMQLTAASTAHTKITTWAAGNRRPWAGAMFPGAEASESNLVVVALGQDGRVSLFNKRGSTHLVGDVLGYYR